MARHAKTYFNIAGGDLSSCGDLAVIEKFSYTEERMTKQQLIEAVSTRTGQGKADVEAVVDSVLGTIAEKLQGNERVDLRGFGSFAVKDKKARQGRNPRTGETIEIAAKRDAGFKPGKDLTEKIGQVGTIAEPA